MNSNLITKSSCALLLYPFLHFLYNLLFSNNEVFEHRSMKKDPLNQIFRKWPPKAVFVNLLDKYHLGMNAGWWSSVRMVLNFWNFFEDFCDVCERGNAWYDKWQYRTDHEFSVAIFYNWVVKVLIWSAY